MQNGSIVPSLVVGSRDSGRESYVSMGRGTRRWIACYWCLRRRSPMPTDDRTRTVTIRLMQMIRGELPWGPVSVAKAGIYEAEMNENGAISVRDCNGDLLGVKPDEFIFVGPIPRQWQKRGRR